MELRDITREEVGAVLERDEDVFQARTGRWAHVDCDSVGRTIAIELLDVSGGVIFDGLPSHARRRRQPGACSFR